MFFWLLDIGIIVGFGMEHRFCLDDILFFRKWEIPAQCYFVILADTFKQFVSFVNSTDKSETLVRILIHV